MQQAVASANKHVVVKVTFDNLRKGDAQLFKHTLVTQVRIVVRRSS